MPILCDTGDIMTDVAYLIEQVLVDSYKTVGIGMSSYNSHYSDYDDVFCSKILGCMPSI